MHREASALSPFPSRHHDHHHCVSTAMDRAVELCAARGARFTEQRKRVLELVWQSHAPVGAYELMERLAAERGTVAPPTIYRALDFLTAQGLVHRIDSLNAFVGCSHPEAGHKAYFLICRSCRTVAEINDRALGARLAASAAASGFTVEMETVELTGTCRACGELPRDHV